jgi:hypothetical protein
MKLPLLLLTFCLAGFFASAQRDTTRHHKRLSGAELSLSSGLTVPTGRYASESITDPQGRYARTGWNIQGEATVYFWKHWGLTALAGHLTNDNNANPSLALHDYTVYRFLMGPTYRTSLGKGFSLKASALTGPQLTSIPYHRGDGAPPTAEALLELHYALGRHLFLVASTDYLWSSYENNYIEKVGTQSFPSTIWTAQNVWEANLGVGIKL